MLSGLHIKSCVHIIEIDFSALQVVGHTIQEQGINSACAEQVFRIDVGMSKGCGNGEPEVMIFSLASARIGESTLVALLCTQWID